MRKIGHFPRGFRWGAATASYQVEGAACEDGKGESVWDRFCLRPGAIYRGQTGATACDHYHRSRGDVALMKELGLNAYRFSVSWPRVLPDGTGRVNPKGLAFYDRLVDALLAAGIEPWLTLFHWDYPVALYARGGWLNPESPAWFAEYTSVVAKALGDRVRHWITQNEPLCFIGTGHAEGRHAPGDKQPPDLWLRAAHHSLLAHGRSVAVLRSVCPKGTQVGMAGVANVRSPQTRRRADIEAAYAAMFRMTDDSHWNNTWWMDPVYLGRYPADGLAIYGRSVPEFDPDDMKVIAQPLDFCGVNLYTTEFWKAGTTGPERVPHPDGCPMNTLRWPINAPAMYWGPRFFHRRYGLPVVITEHGMCNTDWVMRDGCVHDPQRIDFLEGQLAQLGSAIADGVPVSGYFHWSLMDNFEWANGYSQRFGLIHVDYATQRRTPKDSYHWYRGVIAAHSERAP